MRRSHRLRFFFCCRAWCSSVCLRFYPIVESFRLSFYRSILTLPWLGQKMVGWQNYSDLWTDPVALQALRRPPCLRRRHRSLGAATRPWHGAGDERSFRGRGLLRAFVLVPWAIPTVVSSQMWRFIFNDRYGLFNFVLFGGDTARYLAPLADPHLRLWRSWSRKFGRPRRSPR